MQKLLLVYCLLAFLYTNALAQTGGVRGSVVDEESGSFLPGVSVSVEGTTKGVATDEKGDFVLEGIEPGNRRILISLIGYKTQTIDVVVVAGQTQRVAQIKMREQQVGLDEIEIFANYVDNGSGSKRTPPTPISTISALEIEEKMGAQEFPEMLKSTPGVFVNTAGGSWGDSQIRVRGFTSENTAILINGIPVNDMENGRVFWSNWGGLNDVTRNKQVQRGLGVSRLAVSSVGGTVNVIMKPTEHRRGVFLEQSLTNRGFTHRTTLRVSTGLKPGNWAITALGSARWGEGFRQGTYTNAYAYFLSAYKKMGNNHQIVFTAFGAPQTTGRGIGVSQEAYNIVGNRNYNPAWGFYNGQRLNARENRFHKPMFILNHYWDINPKTTLTTSAYYSLGRGGGKSMNRSANTNALDIAPNPAITPNDRMAWQIDFDRLAAANRANNNVTVNNANGSGMPMTGVTLSRYIIQESVNNHDWSGILSTLNTEVNTNLNLTFGLDYRWYRGYHYQRVVNLLGGDYWLDVDRVSNASSNLFTPQRLAREGDKIGYNYNGTVQWMGAFAQAEYSIRNLDVFATVNVVNTSFQRNGLFWNGEYPETSLGKSPRYDFTNVTTKFGMAYRITGRHSIFINAGRFSRAPFFVNAFEDVRVSNIVRSNLKNEVITGLEAGYNYRSPRITANVNVYRTYWDNRTYSDNLQLSNGDFVSFRMNNVNALHQGLEVDMQAQVNPTLSITGMFSLGDWRYNGNPTATILSEPDFGIYPLDKLNSNLSNPTTIYIDRTKVGGVAQTVGSLGFRYRHRKFWTLGGTANYYDNLYSDFNPETRFYSDAFFNRPLRLPNAFTFDVYANKSWKFQKKYYVQLKASLNNVFNNQFLMDAQEGFYRNVGFAQYYFGRTYFLSLVFSVD